MLEPDEAGRILHDSVVRIMNRLMRHRERYLRAFIAATGLHPSECEIQETRDPLGDMIRMRVVPAEQGVNVVALQRSRIHELTACAEGLWKLLEAIEKLNESFDVRNKKRRATLPALIRKEVDAILRKRSAFGTNDGYVFIPALRHGAER